MAMPESTPRRPGKPGQNRDSRNEVFGYPESQASPLPRVGLDARFRDQRHRPVIYFYDKAGAPIAAESVVEVTGDLEVTADGALTVQTELEPLEELTISTHGRGEVVSGSVRVVSDGPIGGVLRFDLPDIGVAGVGASQPTSDALFPARRLAGGISTAAAVLVLTVVFSWMMAKPALEIDPHLERL